MKTQKQLNLNWNHGDLRENVLDVVEEVILHELEQSSTARDVKLMIERRYQRKAISYIEKILGYQAEILNNDDPQRDFSLILVSWL